MTCHDVYIVSYSEQLKRHAPHDVKVIFFGAMGDFYVQEKVDIDNIITHREGEALHDLISQPDPSIDY